jgi:hypothetical protein
LDEEDLDAAAEHLEALATVKQGGSARGKRRAERNRKRG